MPMRPPEGDSPVVPSTAARAVHIARAIRIARAVALLGPPPISQTRVNPWSVIQC